MEITTVRIAAKELGVTRQRVYQLLERGEIGSVRLGRTLLVNVASLRRYRQELQRGRRSD